MKWSSLLPTIQMEVSHHSSLYAIILQLEGNDLLEEKSVVLFQTIIADLLLLNDMFPNTMLLWSGLVEQRACRGVLAPDKMDLARRRSCKAVSHFIGSVGSCSIWDYNISFR